MQTNNSSNKNDQGLNIVDLFMYLASQWKWFLLSILICGGIAWYNYARAPLVYFRSATVIIKDPSNKASTSGLDRCAAMSCTMNRPYWSAFRMHCPNKASLLR